MSKKEKEQKQLIEEIGGGMEVSLGLSPLAARIYALLTLSSYEGLSFEEIRETIQASKSSISVNINVLSQLGYIIDFTKPGIRKRFFKVAKYYQLKSLENYHQALESQIQLVDRINIFNKSYYPEKVTAQKSMGSITQQYLRDQQKLIEKTIKKITTFKKIDTSF